MNREKPRRGRVLRWIPPVFLSVVLASAWATSGDSTRHPEFELARWAARNLTPEERAAATVYTSGEHCPMCSAAHAWVGLGKIVYIASSAQLRRWLASWGVRPGPVAPLPIQEVAPGIPVRGPIPEFEDEIRALYRRCFAPHEGA